MTQTRAALLDLLADVQKDPVYVGTSFPTERFFRYDNDNSFLNYILSRAAFMSHEGFAALIPKLDAFAKARAEQ